MTILEFVSLAIFEKIIFILHDGACACLMREFYNKEENDSDFPCIFLLYRLFNPTYFPCANERTMD